MALGFPIDDHYLFAWLDASREVRGFDPFTLAAQILRLKRINMQLKHAARRIFLVAKDKASKEWRKGGDHVCAGGATRWRSG